MHRDEAFAKAKKLFSEDYNCAQVVLKATIEARDMNIPHVTSLAAGFGAGIGQCGETCGAISGGIIAIGLLLERTYPEPLEHKKKAYEYARILIERFREAHGTVKCNDLLGFDISTPEGYQQGYDDGTYETKCPKFIKTAIEILLDMFPSCDPC